MPTRGSQAKKEGVEDTVVPLISISHDRDDTVCCTFTLATAVDVLKSNELRQDLKEMCQEFVH